MDFAALPQQQHGSPTELNGKPLYFDTAASTWIDPEVLAAMVEQLGSPTDFANPSSNEHAYGRSAEALIAEARAGIAAELGCKTNDCQAKIETPGLS